MVGVKSAKAKLLYRMARQRPYRLEWRTGERNLCSFRLVAGFIQNQLQDQRKYSIQSSGAFRRAHVRDSSRSRHQLLRIRALHARRTHRPRGVRTGLLFMRTRAPGGLVEGAPPSLSK